MTVLQQLTPYGNLFCTQTYGYLKGDVNVKLQAQLILIYKKNMK